MVEDGAARGAERIVRDYLAAMEARDLPRARGFLCDGFEMAFPGAGPMRDPEELVAWAADRYRRIGKDVEAVEATGDVVWMRGTLHGVWPDGCAFAGIRFVDRFELRDGRIARQDVWNDLAEAKAAR